MTSGASEMIFMKSLSRSSRATGPKIRVPRGRELDGRMLTEFTRQREQIESTLQKSRTGVAMAQRDAPR